MIISNSTPSAATAPVEDLRDIKPPLDIPTWLAWLWWTIVILAALVILYFVWRWWREKRLQIPVVPPVPAHIRARQKLEHALDLISQPKPFCIEVSDVTRLYLEERFNFHAPERTTEEFLRELAETDLLSPDQKDSLGRFLESCDLVKFARYEPGETELRVLYASAVRLIDETVPLPEPGDARPTQGCGHPLILPMMFAHPYLLLLLLLLPLFAWLKGWRGRPSAFVYSSVQLAAGLTRARRSQAGAFLAALRWLVLATFIVALAQPRLMKSQTQVKASGIDIVCALDLSGSMKTQDYIVGGRQISRIDMAKPVLEQFIQGRPNDRIGLVVFAAQAYIATPLTLDHDFLLENIDRLEIGTIGSDATAIGDGITTSLNRLREIKSKSKIIVLMTDGANNSGMIDPLTAADAAKALGVKIYTIGLGNQEIVQQMGLPAGFLPDEDTLQKISQMTNGKYYRADNSDKFKAIYAEIDKFEKSEAVINKYTQFQDLFPWFVAGGLALLLLEIALGQTVLRRLP